MFTYYSAHCIHSYIVQETNLRDDAIYNRPDLPISVNTMKKILHRQTCAQANLT